MITKVYKAPFLSLVGLVYFTITIIAHLSFRFSTTSDVGVGMLLSLANAVFLIFPLLWSIMGIIELRIILKSYKKLKQQFSDEHIDNEEFDAESRRLKFCLRINLVYLFLITCQLGYVIVNFEEVNV